MNLKVSVLAAAALLSLGCRDEFARWTKWSQGSVALDPGLTLAEAQRRSTLKITPYGYGYFEVSLPSEALRFPGCTAYYFSLDDDRQHIKSAYFHTEKETWPDVLRELRAMDVLLLAHGWKRDPHSRLVTSLTTNAREAADQVHHDTSIDRFRYVKGNRVFDLAPCGLLDGIGWWQYANHVEMFWRAMTIWVMDEDELKKARATGSPW